MGELEFQQHQASTDSGDWSAQPFENTEIVRGKKEYPLIAKIGEGGEGTSYLSIVDGKKYAVKAAAARHGEKMPQLQQRMEKLITDLQKIKHPLVIIEEDVVAQGNFVFSVRPYVEGVNLEELVERGPAGESETLRMMRELASQLQATHEAGLVHRDVKPKNLVKGEHYHLIDYGIAKRFDGTWTVNTPGTRAYMSPEAELGEAVPASDVYSAGHAALYLLTGKHPDHHLTSRERFDHAKKQLKKLKINKKFKETILKSIDPDVKRRYQNGAALSYALSLIDTPMAGPGMQAKEVTPMERSMQKVHARMGRYEVPEELKGDIAEVLEIFKREYAPFIIERKPVDKELDKQLKETLEWLGYEEVWKDPRYTYDKHPAGRHFIRKRNENKEIDILFAEKGVNNPNHFRFIRTTEKAYQSADWSTPLENRTTIGKAAGIVAGAAAQTAVLIAPPLLLDGPQIMIPYFAHIAATIIGSAINAGGIDAYLEGEDIAKATPAYWVGRPVQLATNGLMSGTRKLATKVRIELDEDYIALKKALVPAKGFTYD